MSKILVTQATLPEFDEYINEIEDIWQTKMLTNMGSKHNLLENELKKFLEISNIVLFTNGHQALELCLQSLCLEGEVITSPFTFISTTSAIVRSGLKPVFCDVNYEDCTIDTTKIEKLITNKTVALMPIHVYGNVCDVEKIEEIAKKYNLLVIYDSAHAFGVSYKGQTISNYGDINMYSFHATKVFNTIEGGALTFSDNKYHEKFTKIKNFGFNGQESVDLFGSNAKMNEFQAAMGLCNLKHIKENIKKRQLIVFRYRKKLKNVKNLRILKPQKDVESNYSYFPIFIDSKNFNRRDFLFNRLADNGIFTRKYFYPITSNYECFAQDDLSNNSTPIAEELSKEVLTLPLFPDLELNVVDKICDLIKNILDEVNG